MTDTQLPLAPLGRISPDIHCARDYERLAPRFMPFPTFEHVAGGSGDDATARANIDALSALAITPRLLRDVSQGNTRTTLLGQARPHPIFLAPVAFQGAFHSGGELETARAAAATQTCMICSTLSSHTLEDIAQAGAPDRWFQLYMQPDRDSTLDLMRRAEAAGYGALVLTLDTPVQAPSLRAQRAGFAASASSANLTAYPNPAPISLEAGESRILNGMMREAPTWADLDWLLAQTRLPVWIKGVLHPEDAQALMTRGVAGLIVSNHGGRTLDGVVSSLRALPAIRAAVGDAAAILFDGGIRSGTDIFKAVALGADGVLVGRLQAYALSVAGALGVGHMLKLLREELELAMALSGCATLADIRKAEVRPENRSGDATL